MIKESIYQGTIVILKQGSKINEEKLGELQGETDKSKN